MNIAGYKVDDGIKIPKRALKQALQELDYGIFIDGIKVAELPEPVYKDFVQKMKVTPEEYILKRADGAKDFLAKVKHTYPDQDPVISAGNMLEEVLHRKICKEEQAYEIHKAEIRQKEADDLYDLFI